MFDADLASRRTGGRNTITGNYNTAETQARIPDQTNHSALIKELIELRAVQNGIKNKLRKVLFAADKDFVTDNFAGNCVDKQGVLNVEEFYRLLREEGPLNLSNAQKTQIRKLFLNLKDQTVPYSTVLKSLEFHGETNEWVVRGGKSFADNNQMSLRNTIDRFCDTNLLNRSGTPEQQIQSLHRKFEVLAQRDFINKSPIDKRPQWSLTQRNSIEMDQSRASHNRTAASIDVKRSLKLNSRALEMLNQTETSPLGLKGNPSFNLDLDEINPIESSHIQRPRSRQRQEQRRHSSTFSSYYLNKQAKELASLITIDDRKNHDFGTNSLILEQDQYPSAKEGPERKSKAGETVATRAMVSFKSELKSLIGNLQVTTQEQNIILNGLRGRIYRNPRDTKNLLARVLQLLKRHKIEPQALNGLRFECKRQINNWRNDLISSQLFTQIFKKFNICMTLDDQKDFYDFLSLGATKNHYNLENLRKMFDVLAKVSYKTQKEVLRNESLHPSKDKILAIGQENYSRFVGNLQKKLQIAFGNNTGNALTFFDLSGHEQLRIDEFLFGVEFFTSGNRLKESMMLFQELDTNQDGVLDEAEFDGLFTYLVGGSAITDKPILNGEKLENEEYGKYMQGSYNTYNKRPLEVSEMLQLPQFQGSVRHKMEMRRRGKEVGFENTAQASFQKQMQRTAAMGKQTRKLVIVPAKPKPRKSHSVMQNHLDSELDSPNRARKRTRSKKAGETGVFDELKRIEQLNTTQQWSQSGTQMGSANKKALKNMSMQVTSLIENQPGQSFNLKCANDDQNRFMSINLHKRQPIFKNYIHNNASILRRETQLSKLSQYRDSEMKEQTYLDRLSKKTSSALGRQAKTGPLHTISRLMKQNVTKFEPKQAFV